MCTALLQLMEIKPLSRISITEITKKAGVSRITFYRHYTSKEDIFIKKMDDLFEEFYSLAQPLLESPTFRYDIAVLLFRFIEKNEDIAKKMTAAGISYLLLEKFKEYLMRIFIVTNDDDHYHAHYIAGGIYATITEWINREHDRSPEAMVSFLEKIQDSNVLLRKKPEPSRTL